MKKVVKITGLSVWKLFILFSLVTPVLPGFVSSFSYSDKLWHYSLFFVLYILWYLNLHTNKNKFVLSFLFSFSFSVFLEFIQIFLPFRSFSFYDILFNLLGIITAIVVMEVIYHWKKPKLLLHICCIGCGAYVSEVLKKDYRLTLYFYNQNIFPEKEYLKRLDTTKKIAKLLKIKLVTSKYNHEDWLKKIKGHELDKERGERCRICYRDRMEKAAEFASKNRFDYFATTLSISPHKDFDAISAIGQELSNKYKIKYLDRNFKKNDGFKKSVLLSKKLNLYRQNYCGCEFSFRADKNR